MDTQQLVGKFFSDFKALDLLRDKKDKEMSNIDNKVSDLYHKIEGMQITNICLLHSLVIQLHQVLRERRQLKLERMLLQSLCDTVREKMNIANKNYIRIIAEHNTLVNEINKNANII